MRKPFLSEFYLTACLLALTTAPAWAGSVDLNTYYPAPFGNYDRLKLAPRASPGGTCDPGTMYVDNTTVTLQFCAANGTWAPGLWTQSGTNLYPAANNINVGIGITAPATTLDVAKNVAPSSGITNILSLQAYDTNGLLNSMNNDGIALNFKSRSNGNVVDIGRISSFLTIAGTPVSSALAFSSYADVGGTNALTETMRIVNSKVGIGTTNPEFKLSIKVSGNACAVDGDCPAGIACVSGVCGYDSGILAVGTFGSGATLADTVLGSARLIWYPRKAAFRAGYAVGSNWDDMNIGDCSVAMGVRTKASGNYSTAMGDGSAATGGWSTAMGDTITTSGNYSTAMGCCNTAASGDYSTAAGKSTTASGDYSTAMGSTTTAQAYASVVLGRYNVISGTTNSWVNTDPLFVIGNGTIGTPANALTVLKNGNIGIGTTNPGTNRLEVSGGNIKATSGIIINPRGDNPAAVAGQVWLCTDIGNSTPCDGI